MTSDTIKCPCCGQVTTAGTDVEFDLLQRTMRYGDKSLRLSGRLLKLAAILAGQMPKFMSHDYIVAKMWGDDDIDAHGNLKVAVCQLRARIEHLGLTIENSWGCGYAMTELSRTERYIQPITGEHHAAA